MILKQLQYALDAMKGKLTARPLDDADRCILCGWANVNGAKDGNCGRTVASETECIKYEIPVSYVGKHLWFSEILQYIKQIEHEKSEAGRAFEFLREKVCHANPGH